MNFLSGLFLDPYPQTNHNAKVNTKQTVELASSAAFLQ
jgi:hypothetical protein